VDDQAGLGEAAVDEFGPVLDPFERETDGVGQLVQADRDEVGQRAPLDQRPDALVGLISGAYFGSDITRSKSLARCWTPG